MNKKITAISMTILILSLSLTVGGIKLSRDRVYTDVSLVDINTYAANNVTKPSQSLSEFVGDKVDKLDKTDELTGIGGIINDASEVIGGVGDIVGGGSLGDIGGSLGNIGGSLGGLGNLGDVVGGLGGAVGGILGGGATSSSGNSGTNTSPTYEVDTETMAPIVVVPAASDVVPTFTTIAPVISTNPRVNETVDFSATQNPYKKPTGELRGGATGEGVKWMQWMFIYTRYGLKDDGITGVFDEDTMAVVKKLQKENGMTTDGIVNDAVIDKIDLLYFQATYTTTSPATMTQATTAAPVQAPVEDKNADETAIVALGIIVAAVWVVAIAFIVVFFVMKKKNGSVKATENKGNAKNKKSKMKKSAKPVDEASTDILVEEAVVGDSDSSIAELFEKNED